MKCSDLEKKFDLYVDGMLAESEDKAMCEHVRTCRSCEEAVTRHQKTSSLLSTAVADMATAVDISSLRDDVLAALDGMDGMDHGPAPSWAAVLRDRVGRAFAPTPASIGIWGGAAAVAAAVVFMFVWTPQPQRVQLAASTATATRSAPVRVDSLEAGYGYTVSTWRQPGTRTRVIWVDDVADIFIAQAGYDK
jgi:anti-sigma factor RsiW